MDDPKKIIHSTYIRGTFKSNTTIECLGMYSRTCMYVFSILAFDSYQPTSSKAKNFF